MRGSLAGLLAAQVLFAAIGLGLLSLLRVVAAPKLELARLGLAYMLGVSAVGVLSANLALADVALGLPELSVLAALTLAAGAFRMRRLARPTLQWRWAGKLEGASTIVAGGALLVTLVLLGYAAHAFAVRPLFEWDGWAIWATKARALYEFGGVYKPVFTTYEPVTHPLLLPSLEAIDFRAMGALDTTLVHVQLVGLGFGFAAALVGLLHDCVPRAVLAVSLLALVSAPPVLVQLASNRADVPLAFFVALGLVALGRFIVTRESWPLSCAALFFGAAMLTKSEGLLLFAAAAVGVVPALVRAGRGLALRAALAGLGAVAMLLPWRAFLAVHDLKNAEYRFARLGDFDYLADRTERAENAAGELWRHISADEWGYLVVLCLLAIGACLLASRLDLAAFAALWPVLSFMGLVGVYWISVVPIRLTLSWTAARTTTPLVVGMAALAPLLVAQAWPLRAPTGNSRSPTAPARDEPRP